MRKELYDCSAYIDRELILNSMIVANNFKDALNKFVVSIKETCEEENFDVSKVKKWIERTGYCQ